MTSSAAGMFQYENSTSGGVTAAGRAIMHGSSVTGVSDPALEAATAAVLSPKFMPAGAMPQLANFSTQVWNSVQPVLQAMSWMNATVPQNSEFLRMRPAISVIDLAGTLEDLLPESSTCLETHAIPSLSNFGGGTSNFSASVG